jgi:predicted DNA-binding transcriptional regulator AlpA
LSTAELLQRIPLVRQTVWKMVRAGTFPPPISLTAHRIGWRWTAVEAWLAERESRPVSRRQYFDADTED